jgi:WhiB family redox-sensing transcriptional regulator
MTIRASSPTSATPWQWQQHGDCGFYGPSVFFGPETESRSARRRREHEAKTICRTCPVRDPCRDYATANAERHGIWGGLSFAERATRKRVSS